MKKDPHAPDLDSSPGDIRKTRKVMPLSEDPNTYWFWLQPFEPFEVRYAPNWEAKARSFIGPFSFRLVAERERADRLVSGASLKLISGGKKKED